MVKPLLWTPPSAADMRRGDGEEVEAFAEAMCRVTKDTIAGKAGELMRIRGWQSKYIFRPLYARDEHGDRIFNTGLIGMPRKNGKSGVASPIGLHGLYMGPAGGEVYAAANDKLQARIVFDVARRMVELEPELAAISKIYRDAIEVVSTGSVFRVLSADAFTKEGLNPHLVIYDEVHAAPSPELWEVLELAMGAREDPLIIGVTTAGKRTDRSGQFSHCYKLFLHGEQIAKGEVVDPTFYMAWWGAPNSCDHRKVSTWKRSNPGFDDLIAERDFAAKIKRTRESEYRTKRLNQWVDTAENFFPAGKFELCGGAEMPEHGSRIITMCDGSWSGDSTGILAQVVGGPAWVAGHWEKPPNGDDDWRVNPDDVKQIHLELARDYEVVEMAFDPFLMTNVILDLQELGLPVVEFVTSAKARMGKASQLFYEDVMAGDYRFVDSPALERHVINASVKQDQFGYRVTKEKPGSQKKIDLAVCAIGANSRATHYQPEDEPEDVSIAWA